MPEKIARAAETPHTEWPDVRPHKNVAGAVVIVVVLGLIGLGVFFGQDHGSGAAGGNGESGAVVGDYPNAGDLICATSPKVFAVLIQSGSQVAFGSAFAVTRRDLITNRHVVEDIGEGGQALIRHAKWHGKPRRGVVRKMAENVDLAWIELVEPIDCDPLAISGTAARQGDKVSVLGYPGYAYGVEVDQQLEPTYTSGEIKAVNRIVEGMPCYETSAVINGGNSGGPLLNSRGEVIGVNTLKIVKTGLDGAFFAIKIELLKTAIPELWRKIH